MIHLLEWLRAEDVRLFHAIYGVHPELLGGAMVALSAMGGGAGVLAIAPLLGPKRTRPFALSLAATLIATSLLVAGLKQVVGRVRPLAALEGVRALDLPAPTDPSFPSGHAAGAFAFALFVAVVLIGRKPRTRLALAAAGAALLFAFAVALSRVYLGVHYPIDVACGAVLGGGLGAAMGRFHARRL